MFAKKLDFLQKVPNFETQLIFEPVDGFSNLKKVNNLEFWALSIGSILDPDPQKRLDLPKKCGS